MARIFAKALNCPNVDEDGVPCNTCEICRGISTGQDVDVSEIDGASNRGIDDIRSLRANVGVKSMRSTYKVYIIDEVHMLTKEAFNALLKTLEEPPPRVKFIFCTTEPNKIPTTILSRCQQFNFGTISVDNISLRLSQLAEAEGYQVESAALELVARRAAGSMRDSQSLFDQLLAFGTKTITSADVHRLLGTAPDDRVIEMMDALINRDRASVLQLLEGALNEGIQLEALTDQLVGYFRDLMVQACGAVDAALVSVGSDQRPKLHEQASRWGLQTIVAAMQIMAEAKARMQRVTYGRALAELALVRISMLEDLDRLDELVAKLRGGGLGLPSGSTASRPPVSPTGSLGLPTAHPQKKNDLTEPARVETGEKAPERAISEHSDRAGVIDSDPETPPEIEWKPGCEKELHAAIIGRLNDMTGTYLRRVVGTAISGPSQLDFSFPPTYDLDRKACDRPEVVSRLEAIVKELVGQRIRIRFCTSDAGPVPIGKTALPVPAAAPKSRFVELPEDEYLQAVMQVFGTKVWKVEPQMAEAERDSAACEGEE
jgi:DNA polymerase-3 subunit gamma/tau